MPDESNDDAGVIEISPETEDADPSTTDDVNGDRNFNDTSTIPRPEINYHSVALGDQYDVLDASSRWCEGEVIKKDPWGKKILISYLHWDSRYNEWILNVSDRLAPLHTHTYVEGGVLKIGQRIEAADERNEWLEAFVLEESNNQIKVHYKGFHHKFDTWLDRDDVQKIRPFRRNINRFSSSSSSSAASVSAASARGNSFDSNSKGLSTRSGGGTFRHREIKQWKVPGRISNSDLPPSGGYNYLHDRQNAGVISDDGGERDERDHDDGDDTDFENENVHPNVQRTGMGSKSSRRIVMRNSINNNNISSGGVSSSNHAGSLNKGSTFGIGSMGGMMASSEQYGEEKHHGGDGDEEVEENGDGQERTRRITELSDQYLRYTKALERHGLTVVPVSGDGNCLFRSVAHQIYGDDSLHGLVRQKCVDYMESEADFFCMFVEGGRDSFPYYLRAKRLDACWGDDPEITAICELYNRPAEIWAYDTSTGARKLRTFHEAAIGGVLGVGAAAADNIGGAVAGVGAGLVGASAEGGMGGRPVMRLSYYGGGHYDSVVGADFHQNLFRSKPGDAEELSLARSRQRNTLGHSRGVDAANSAINTFEGTRENSKFGGVIPSNVLEEQNAIELAQATSAAEAVAKAEQGNVCLASDREATEQTTLDLAIKESRRAYAQSRMRAGEAGSKAEGDRLCVDGGKEGDMVDMAGAGLMYDDDLETCLMMSIQAHGHNVVLKEEEPAPNQPSSSSLSSAGTSVAADPCGSSSSSSASTSLPPVAAAAVDDKLRGEVGAKGEGWEKQVGTELKVGQEAAAAGGVSTVGGVEAKQPVFGEKMPSAPQQQQKGGKQQEEVDLISLQSDLLSSVQEQSEREYIEKAIMSSLVEQQRKDQELQEKEILLQLQREAAGVAGKSGEGESATEDQLLEEVKRLSEQEFYAQQKRQNGGFVPFHTHTATAGAGTSRVCGIEGAAAATVDRGGGGSSSIPPSGTVDASAGKRAGGEGDDRTEPASTAGTKTEEDPDVEMALKLSQMTDEEAFEFALQQSVMQQQQSDDTHQGSWGADAAVVGKEVGRRGGGGAGYGFAHESEEEMLQRALAASMQDETHAGSSLQRLQLIQQQQQQQQQYLQQEQVTAQLDFGSLFASAGADIGSVPNGVGGIAGGVRYEDNYVRDFNAPDYPLFGQSSVVAGGGIDTEEEEIRRAIEESLQAQKQNR